MNTSPSPQDQEYPNAADALAMLEQLKSSKMLNFKHFWPAYFCAVFGGIFACFISSDVLFYVYFPLIAVVLSLHDLSRRRTQVQVDLILRILEERQKTESHVSKPLS